MIIIILIINLVIFVRLLIFIFNLVVSKKYINIRVKNTPFECGFEVFESIRLPFSIHFFLIAILFLVFDVEIIFLFPIIFGVMVINFITWILCSLVVLVILFLGLEFEKNEGFLKWFI